MSLRDNSTREKRVRHVLKHFFCVAERYWDLTGDLESWLARWRLLQAADALDPYRTEQVEQVLSSRQAVDSGFTEWFGLAQQGLREGQLAGQDFPLEEPGKRIYVGLGGLLIVVLELGNDEILLSSYRAVPSWGRRSREPAGSASVWEEEALIRARTAVRRATRRASIGAGPVAGTSASRLDMESRS